MIVATAVHCFDAQKLRAAKCISGMPFQETGVS